MKNKLFSLSGVFMAVMLLREASCSEMDSPKAMMPLAVGNEWVYIDSVYHEGRLFSARNDTMRVAKSSTFEGRTTYIFSDGREVFLKGDTLFQLVQQRSAIKFPTTVFYASEKADTFNFMFGGDVSMQRIVSRMTACPKNELGADRCYRVTDQCHGQIILAYGVGIVKEKIADCLTISTNYTVRTLVSIKVK